MFCATVVFTENAIKNKELCSKTVIKAAFYS